MFNLQRAKKSPTIFRHLTDVTPQAFEELMTVLKEAYPEFERKRLSRREVEFCYFGDGKVKAETVNLMLRQSSNIFVFILALSHSLFELTNSLTKACKQFRHFLCPKQQNDEQPQKEQFGWTEVEHAFHLQET